MKNEAEVSVVPFWKAAERLASTPREVKNMVKADLLVGVILPARKRYSGVTSDSLEKLIEKSVTNSLRED